MPMHRSNSNKGATIGKMGADWFHANKARQRKRNKAARAARAKGRK